MNQFNTNPYDCWNGIQPYSHMQFGLSIPEYNLLADAIDIDFLVRTLMEIHIYRKDVKTHMSKYHSLGSDGRPYQDFKGKMKE